ILHIKMVRVDLGFVGEDTRFVPFFLSLLDWASKDLDSFQDKIIEIMKSGDKHKKR
ncbi:unnamed protein product, partial [Allacma fusca]